MSTSIRAEPILLPRMRWPSLAIVPGSIVASTPEAGMPTITIVPARRSSSAPCSTARRRADRDDDVVGAASAGEREDGGDGVLRRRS